MTPLDPATNQRYQSAGELPPALWDDLAARAPREAAQAAGATWEKGNFRLALLGREYLVDPAARSIVVPARDGRPASFQAGMVLLVALARAVGAPPSGRMVTPLELPGGSLFFTGPHALPLAPLCARFGAKPGELLARGQALGGRAEQGADAAVVVPGLPFAPLQVLVWAGDDEFPPRAVIGIDDRVHLSLPLDAIWALCNLLVRRLTEG